MNLNASINASQLLGVWGTPKDPYWCIKPIFFKTNDTVPQRKFVNLLGKIWLFVRRAASWQGLITNQTLFNIQHNSKKVPASSVTQ